MKVIVSWSGGKDSCLACYRALEQSHEVAYLVNFISREFRRVSFHGTRAQLISRQAQAIGIPLAQYTVPSDLSVYEKRFKKAVSTLQRNGIEGMVFGDRMHDPEHIIGNRPVHPGKHDCFIGECEGDDFDETEPGEDLSHQGADTNHQVGLPDGEGR